MHPERFPLWGGAMPVSFSAPCHRKRWFLLTFGILGARNTLFFRSPAGTSPASARLFLGTAVRLMRASEKTLTDVETGITICMVAHLAVWTQHQGRTHGIAFLCG